MSIVNDTSFNFNKQFKYNFNGGELSVIIHRNIFDTKPPCMHVNQGFFACRAPPYHAFRAIGTYRMIVIFPIV